MAKLEYSLNMVLLEDLESKMPYLINQLLSKKSRWQGKKIDNEEHKKQAAEEIIKKLSEYDPTDRNKYIPFLVHQVALGVLKPSLIDEDGPKINYALSTFATKGKQWSGEKDLMAYKDYRNLLRDVIQYEKITEKESKTKKGTKEQEREARYKGTTLFVDMKIPTNKKWVGDDWEKEENHESHFKIYEITDPNAAALWGKGTQWCTSSSPWRDLNKVNKSPKLIKQEWEKVFKKYDIHYPWSSYEEVEKEIDNAFKNNHPKVPNPHFAIAIDIAADYLEDGPLYVVYVDGHPYMQLNSAGDQIMNINDVPLAKISYPTAKALVELMKSTDIPRTLQDEVIKVIKNSKKK